MEGPLFIFSTEFPLLSFVSTSLLRVRILPRGDAPFAAASPLAEVILRKFCSCGHPSSLCGLFSTERTFLGNFRYALSFAALTLLMFPSTWVAPSYVH